MGDREGQVQEITWRATKLRTKAGQFLIVPNGMISKEAILNYSEPTIPTRLEVEVGASYRRRPTRSRRRLREALGNCAAGADGATAGHAAARLRARRRSPIACSSGSATTRSTRRRAIRCAATSGTRSGAATSRSRIRSRLQYSREEAAAALGRRRDGGGVAAGRDRSVRDRCPPIAASRCRATAHEHIFAAGEAIVRQDEAGSSMFVVLSGRVRVVLEPSGQEVAVIEPGGFFGEMSMLTGDPRTATVRAIDDVRALEIPAERFRDARASSSPDLVEHISTVVAARRAELDDARAAAAARHCRRGGARARSSAGFRNFCGCPCSTAERRPNAVTYPASRHRRSAVARLSRRSAVPPSAISAVVAVRLSR